MVYYFSEKFAADVDFVIETYKNENFFEALDEIGERLAKRGLTEEIVNEILNSKNQQACNHTN